MEDQIAQIQNWFPECDKDIVERSVAGSKAERYHQRLAASTIREYIRSSYHKTLNGGFYRYVEPTRILFHHN
jgi:hypothetical protein